MLTRPLVRGLTNALAWMAALWGFEVTTDLLALVSVAVLVGTVNFFFAVQDERKLAAASKAAQEDRAILRELQKLTRENGVREIPIRLQDLSIVSNDRLKGLVAQAATNLREYERQSRDIRSQGPIWLRIPNYEALSDEQRDALWRKDTADLIEGHQQQESDFRRIFLPDASAIWTELKRRVFGSEAYPKSAGRVPIALEHGSLAGVAPISEATLALEDLARRL